MQTPLKEEDYYLSPEGFIVFTEAYHLKRGYCCGNGCRHCPYTQKESGENSNRDSESKSRSQR